MIELGRLRLSDDESATLTRRKLLGMLRALDVGDVLATRVATCVSATARSYTRAGTPAICLIALNQDDRGLALEITFEGPGEPADAESLRLVTDALNVRHTDPHRIHARIALGISSRALTSSVIRRESARLQQRSRRELMEELRDKNKELEAHNEALEDMVAERTRELSDANARMRRDLEAGVAYVRALIPPPMERPICIDWRYIPSSDLGGDTIGYHWLDGDRLACYLIDVTGHGLDSALLSVTVTNVVRAGTLQGVDMARPGDVLAALNDAFPAASHGNKFFTMWYGVYNVRTHDLVWAGAGHHPAALLQPGVRELRMLESTGPLLGAVTGLAYDEERCIVPPGSRLLISSDGVFEILRDGVVVWSLQEFHAFLGNQAAVRAESLLDDILAKAQRLRGPAQFDDDVSLIEVTF